eukprot:6174576-Pleurochrysis_carterae.AAC.3
MRSPAATEPSSASAESAVSSATHASAAMLDAKRCSVANRNSSCADANSAMPPAVANTSEPRSDRTVGRCCMYCALRLPRSARMAQCIKSPLSCNIRWRKLRCSCVAHVSFVAVFTPPPPPCPLSPPSSAPRMPLSVSELALSRCAQSCASTAAAPAHPRRSNVLSTSAAMEPNASAASSCPLPLESYCETTPTDTLTHRHILSPSLSTSLFPSPDFSQRKCTHRAAQNLVGA